MELLERAGCLKCWLPRISVVGAGGKTTVIKELAEGYKARGQQCLITTTTHMRAEDDPRFFLEPFDSAKDFRVALGKEGYIFLGSPAKQGKMGALSERWQTYAEAQDTPLLIEADGSRRFPVKAPEEWEPVLWPGTTCVVAVYGLGALGKSIEDVCFRPDAVSCILGKTRAEQVTPEDIAYLAASYQGGRKCVKEDMFYAVLLNQADTKEQWKAARKIGRLLQAEKIPVIIRGNDGEREELVYENTD